MSSVSDSQDSSINKNDRIREFVGKVKIILVDSPKRVYMRKRWAAAFITLSQIMIGITNMFVLFYVLSFKSEFLTNVHIFLCTVGFQLCIPVGMLGLNSLNGPSMPMNVGDKKFEHVFVETFGLICCMLGTIAIIFERNLITEKGLHGFLGIIAGFLVVLSAIVGICSNGKGMFVGFMKNIHIMSAVGGFISSSMCFILGLYMPCMEKWAPVPSVISYLVIFCSVYSAVVTISSFRRLYKK